MFPKEDHTYLSSAYARGRSVEDTFLNARWIGHMYKISARLDKRSLADNDDGYDSDDNDDDDEQIPCQQFAAAYTYVSKLIFIFP